MLPVARSSFDSALWGMRAAQGMALDSARTIASGDFDRYADAFVGLVRAKHSFAANVKVVQVQHKMDRSLLDIFA